MTRIGGKRGWGWRTVMGWVVHLYPRDFRRSLGEDMCAVFDQEMARRRKRGGRMASGAYGVGTLTAAVAGALREHLHQGAHRVSARRHAAATGPSGGPTNDEGRGMMGQDLRQDLMLLLRQIRRRPGFAVVVVLTLALGIGINTGVFTVVRDVLLRPLPFPDSHELVTVTGGGASSLPNLRDLDDRLESMDVMAGVFTPQTMTLTGQGDATQLNVSIVTPTFFRMTALAPAVGRWLGPEDEGTSRVVLSHRLWVSRFGGDPAVVGRSITLDDGGSEVVGVAPEEIADPFDEDAWMANPWPAGKGPRASRTWRAVNVYGRLAPGWTVTEARKELATEWERLKKQYPEENGRWAARLSSLKDYVTDSEQAPLKILFLASSLFLLLACLNVASVFLSRLDTRRHEFAVRSSLGAGRWRLLRQAWTEALAISAVGGLLGVALANVSVESAIRLLGIRLPLTGHLGLDGMVVGFALAVTSVTALVVGGMTVVAWGTDQPAQVLRSTAGAVVNRSGLVRRTLVVGEVAMAFVIVTGLGLLLRSFQKIQSADTGIRPDGVVTASLGRFPASRYPDNESRLTFMERLTERAAAIPGVDDVAFSSHRPIAGCCSNGPYNRTADPDRVARFVETRWVTPSYFKTMGIPVLAGSDLSNFGPDDPPAVLIDEGLARDLFGDESPVGATLSRGSDTVRVVGVVGAVREYSPVRKAPEIVYVSARQSPMSSPHLVVRTNLPLDRLVPAMRQALQDIDPLLPMERIQSMDDVLASFTTDQRATTYLMSLLGALAVLLGGVGIYGVMSQTVQGSLREIGVRLVLGARREEVRRRILRNALVLVLPGIVLGLVGTVAAHRLVTSLLYQTSPLDPVVYVLVVVLFVVAPLLAAWPPARRAAKVEAVEMLRDA